MSLRQILTRLFRLRRPALSSPEIVREDIDRRARVRQTHPIANACRANGLTEAQRRQVFRHFESLGASVGLAEARAQAVNLAAQLGRRRSRHRPHTDPWTGPSAA